MESVIYVKMQQRCGVLPFGFRAFESVHQKVVGHYNPHI